MWRALHLRKCILVKFFFNSSGNCCHVFCSQPEHEGCTPNWVLSSHLVLSMTQPQANLRQEPLQLQSLVTVQDSDCQQCQAVPSWTRPWQTGQQSQPLKLLLSQTTSMSVHNLSQRPVQRLSLCFILNWQLRVRATSVNFTENRDHQWISLGTVK